jgi:hypothetical protein
MAKKRNRAAQDATLINVRALKTRVRDLERRCDAIVRGLGGRIAKLERKVR